MIIKLMFHDVDENTYVDYLDYNKSVSYQVFLTRLNLFFDLLDFHDIIDPNLLDYDVVSLEIILFYRRIFEAAKAGEKKSFTYKEYFAKIKCDS